MTNPKVKSDLTTEFINNQREFLHDVTGPAGRIQLMIELMTENMAKDSWDKGAEQERLQKVMKAVDQLLDLIKKNREFLRTAEARREDGT